MFILLGIIISIIIFSIIVLVHEWGHFYTARKFGVKVYEFGLGLPPKGKEVYKDKKGTIYTLNWLPLGGFVRLAGENINTFPIYDSKGNPLSNDEILEKIKKKNKLYLKDGKTLNKEEIKMVKDGLMENNADYALCNKPAWQQAVVLLAGVFMNFVLAAFIFSMLFFVGVKPIGVNTKIATDMDLKLIPTMEQAKEKGLILEKPGLILNPVDGSYAESVGIKQKDLLIGINDEAIGKPLDMIEKITSNKGEQITFNLDREGKLINIIFKVPKEGKIGSYVGENIEINKEFEYKYGFIDSIKYGTKEMYYQSILTLKGLKMILTKIFAPETPKEREEALNQMSGPIGIVDFITQSVGAGIIFLIIIGAIISINLGVFNLLPIPALDGGRFLVLSINAFVKKIFGKKVIGERFEGLLHVGFFVILIILSILIAYNDILRIVER